MSTDRSLARVKETNSVLLSHARNLRTISLIIVNSRKVTYKVNRELLRDGKNALRRLIINGSGVEVCHYFKYRVKGKYPHDINRELGSQSGKAQSLWPYLRLGKLTKRNVCFHRKI